ncbi:MAG: hypothetical protein ACLU07_05890 [Lachnospirales bacterium]
MEIYNILIIIAFVLFMIIICLAFAYWYITYKKKNDIVNNKKSTKIKSEAQQTNSYTKVPIFNFMQFDKIQDNMIVQDNGNKYLMVLACEGVNYDLMSEVEKNRCGVRISSIFEYIKISYSVICTNENNKYREQYYRL